jgi:hypothetical protein
LEVALDGHTRLVRIRRLVAVIAVPLTVGAIAKLTYD